MVVIHFFHQNPSIMLGPFLTKHFTGVAFPVKEPTKLSLMLSLRVIEMQLGLGGWPNSLSSCFTPKSLQPSRARLVHCRSLTLQPQLPTRYIIPVD